MTVPETNTSPRWNNTTKLVVALSVVALLGMLIIRFKYILAPILFAFILAYLFHPLASFLHRKFKIPWRLVATVLYLLLLIIILGLLTWGGISIVEQVQNLIGYLQRVITDLPGVFEKFSSTPLMIGPFKIDLSQFDLENLWATVQDLIQPLLTNLGGLIGTLASGIGSTITWLFFIIIISYFILSESGSARENLIKLRIPNYQEDLSRMGKQLSQIWNAFLRGQLLVFAITVTYYSILLAVLGMRYFFLLALLAGLARFVPYVGPFVAWTTYGLVALFQTNYFNLLPFPYALLVVGCALLSDLFMDNYVSPRVMSDALRIHPAAVLVMVIVSASLFGLLGVLLAAPVLASLQLLLTYTFRKLMDENPWEGLQTIAAPEPLKERGKRMIVKIRKMLKRNNVENSKRGKPPQEER